MIYGATFLSIIGFVVGLRLFGVLPAAANAIQTTGAAVRNFSDRGLSDLEKERLLKKASLELMQGFLSISVRTVAAFAIAVVPLLALDITGIVRLNAVTDLLASWRGIALTSAVMIAAYFARIRN